MSTIFSFTGGRSLFGTLRVMVIETIVSGRSYRLSLFHEGGVSILAYGNRFKYPCTRFMSPGVIPKPLSEALRSLPGASYVGGVQQCAVAALCKASEGRLLIDSFLSLCLRSSAKLRIRMSIMAASDSCGEGDLGRCMTTQTPLTDSSDGFQYRAREQLVLKLFASSLPPSLFERELRRWGGGGAESRFRPSRSRQAS